MAASTARDEPFDCRLHLQEILGFVRSYSGPRDGHFFDFFSGVGQASKTFKAKGYKTHNFDILSGGDLVTRTGFFAALAIFMSLVRGALVLLGPPCSLWVYMSNSFHGRRKHMAAGDLSKAAVRAANTLIRNVVFLLALGHYRGIFSCWNNPHRAICETTRGSEGLLRPCAARRFTPASKNLDIRFRNQLICSPIWSGLLSYVAYGPSDGN